MCSQQDTKEGDRVRSCYGDALWCQRSENKLMCQMEESSLNTPTD